MNNREYFTYIVLAELIDNHLIMAMQDRYYDEIDVFYADDRDVAYKNLKDWDCYFDNPYF
jgi:hypothetical protein